MSDDECLESLGPAAFTPNDGMSFTFNCFYFTSLLLKDLGVSEVHSASAVCMICSIDLI